MTSVKMEKRGFVLSCRKGQSRDRGDGIGKGCQETSLWWVGFYVRFLGQFSTSTDFFTLAIHLVFPQTILRLEIKMPDCPDSQWYVWLKKMNIESTQYVFHEFQKRRGCRSPCKTGCEEGGMKPLFKICWCGIWSL